MSRFVGTQRGSVFGGGRSSAQGVHVFKKFTTSNQVEPPVIIPVHDIRRVTNAKDRKGHDKQRLLTRADVLCQHQTAALKRTVRLSSVKKIAVAVSIIINVPVSYTHLTLPTSDLV